MNTKFKPNERIVTFSVLKATEGGQGYWAMSMLHEAGIPARKGFTILMGHVGIEVPKRLERRASNVLYGGRA